MTIPQGKAIYKEYSYNIAAVDVLFIAPYIWVLTATEIKVLSYYDYTSTYDLYQSEYEFDEYDADLFKTNDGGKLKVIATIAIGGTSFTNSGTHVYVQSSSAIKSVDITTYAITDITSNLADITVNSKLVYADKAIWLIDKWVETAPDTHDYLWKFDLTAGSPTWVRHCVLRGRQTASRKFCTGKNGYLYISNRNTADVLKVSTSMQNTLSNIRIDFVPEYIIFDEVSNKIIVHTANNKLVNINRDTNEITNLLYTTSAVIAFTGLTSDGAYWFKQVAGGVTKMNADLTTSLRSGGNYSFTITSGKVLSPFTKMIIIPEHTVINHVNGYDLVINEYILLMGLTSISIFRNKENYSHANYLKITGQGMIYSGNDFYTGESS